MRYVVYNFFRTIFVVTCSLLITSIVGFIWQTNAHNFVWIRLGLTAFLLTCVFALAIEVVKP